MILPPDPPLARAWLDLGNAGWAEVRVAAVALERLGYVTAELRGARTLLRVAGARLDTSELWVMPP